MTLSERERNMISSVLERFSEIEKVVLFGSRALGCARPESDVDLAVWGDISDARIGMLTGELEELPTPLRFDVQAYAHIRHAGLRRHIDELGTAIFQRA